MDEMADSVLLICYNIRNLLNGGLVMKMSVEDMRDELEDFFEAAGFADFYDRVLKDMTDEQIIDSYNEVFSEEDPELEKWERLVKGEE